MIKYDIFTYQISPITNIQTDIFGHSYSTDDLNKMKNKFFFDILTKLEFYSNKNKLNYKIEYKDNEFILLRLANIKRVKLEKNFHKEYYESEPSCLIGIHNNPEIQLLAIESDKTSFGNSFTVLKIFEKAVDKKLKLYYLRFYPQPKYEEKILWELLKKFEGRIEKLQFEFSRPNLSRVNESLSEELREASKALNSAKTKLEFSAPDEQVLENLNKDNTSLSDLVKASSEGAGPAKLKLNGFRSWEKTDNSVKSIEFDSLEIEANDETINKFANEFKNKIKYE
jgi:hypothetical protein